MGRTILYPEVKSQEIFSRRWLMEDYWRLCAWLARNGSGLEIWNSVRRQCQQNPELITCISALLTCKILKRHLVFNFHWAAALFVTSSVTSGSWNIFVDFIPRYWAVLGPWSIFIDCMAWYCIGIWGEEGNLKMQLKCTFLNDHLKYFIISNGMHTCVSGCENILAAQFNIWSYYDERLVFNPWQRYTWHFHQTEPLSCSKSLQK